MISDTRLEGVERAALRGKPTGLGTLEVCRSFRAMKGREADARAAIAREKDTADVWFRALRFALDQHEAAQFRAKSRAWFGRSLVLSLGP